MVVRKTAFSLTALLLIPRGIARQCYVNRCKGNLQLCGQDRYLCREGLTKCNADTCINSFMRTTICPTHPGRSVACKANCKRGYGCQKCGWSRNKSSYSISRGHTLRCEDCKCDNNRCPVKISTQRLGGGRRRKGRIAARRGTGYEIGLRSVLRQYGEPREGRATYLNTLQNSGGPQPELAQGHKKLREMQRAATGPIELPPGMAAIRFTKDSKILWLYNGNCQDRRPPEFMRLGAMVHVCQKLKKSGYIITKTKPDVDTARRRVNRKPMPVVLADGDSLLYFPPSKGLWGNTQRSQPMLLTNTKGNVQDTAPKYDNIAQPLNSKRSEKALYLLRDYIKKLFGRAYDGPKGKKEYFFHTWTSQGYPEKDGNPKWQC